MNCSEKATVFFKEDTLWNRERKHQTALVPERVFRVRIFNKTNTMKLM